MIELKSMLSIVLMLFLYLFGSRDIAYQKDFIYFEPSQTVRKILYIRGIPNSKITLASIATQVLIVITIVMQTLSILGTDILKPILSQVWFGKYSFPLYDSPSFQAMFCIVGVFLPGVCMIILYFLICTIFADNRYD